MKVLQINSVCGVGSTGRIVVDLYKALEEQGHECIVAYGRGEAPKGIRSIKIGSEFSVNIHGMLSRLSDRQGFYSKDSTKKLVEEIIDYDPDIIHLHNIHGYYINVEILFKYLIEANKPVIWTLHDCWAFTGHCAYFDYVGCTKWQYECNKCPQKRSYPSSFLMDNSKENFRRKKELFTSVKNMTIVTPSKWLAELVKQSFLSGIPVKVIPNGIDLSVFKPTHSDFRMQNNIEEHFIILGVASVWDRRKGLYDFLELSNIVDDKYKIVLVGLEHKQIKYLPKNVVGINRTNSIDELTQIYSTADLFFNPTSEDNFPTTNLEALACGTPILTYDTGGSIESADNSCGVITKERNQKNLFEFIQKFDWNSLNSTNCTNRAKLYDKKLKAQEYTKIYNEGLKNEHSPY